MLRAAHERLRTSLGGTAKVDPDGEIPRATTAEVTTAVPAERLTELNDQLLRTPDDFTVHPKLARQLERRRVAIAEGGVDWGQAEALAYASLLVDGIPVRLTGQDSQRGTFAQRHLVLHDVHTGETFTPMQHLDDADASFEVFNSPLSEYGCLGFEYGYSAAAPEALVIWEAQYGDFANGAQIVIDQFISLGALQVARDVAADAAACRTATKATGRALERSTGAVPPARRAGEHPRRQLHDRCAVLPSPATPGARRDGARARGRDAEGPAAPEGCVVVARRARERRGSSRCSTTPTVDKSAVRRLVLCSGKIYFDLITHEAHTGGEVAVARVEQLYPFPTPATAALVASYPSLSEVVWAQEEPQNMGPWRSIRHRLEETAAGTPLATSAARGGPARPRAIPTAHGIEQDRIARAALTL